MPTCWEYRKIWTTLSKFLQSAISRVTMTGKMMKNALFDGTEERLAPFRLKFIYVF